MLRRRLGIGQQCVHHLGASRRSIGIPTAIEAAADHRARSWVIHVPPTCWRITLEIFLLVDDPSSARARFYPSAPRAVFYGAAFRCSAAWAKWTSEGPDIECPLLRIKRTRSNFTYSKFCVRGFGRIEGIERRQPASKSTQAPIANHC